MSTATLTRPKAKAPVPEAPEEVTQQPTYSNIKVKIGPMITVPVAVCGMFKDPNTKTHYTCPGEHDHVVRVSERYLCLEDPKHGPYSQNELGRCRPVGDTLVALTVEEIEAAKFADVVKQEITVTPYPAGDVLDSTRPGKLQYRLRPQGKASPSERDLYGALLAMAEDAQHVWVGRLRIKDSYAMYRLEVNRGQLCLTELIHPDAIHAVDDLSDIVIGDDAREMAQQLAPALVQDWDPEVYRNDAAARLDQAAAAHADGVAVAPVVAKPAQVLDLAALLQASVASAKPARKNRAA